MSDKPTRQQLHWQRQEFGMFCHFGINTFYGKEWSDGTLDPAGYNPARLDARQWVQTAQEAGMRYLIFTAKHHDGFCNWPTETTNYSVCATPWKGGKGDVVGELAEACRDAGMPLGLYLSPWDRHEPCYPDATAYDRFYTRQLTELCTRYGPLFEIWFDGAGSAGRVYDWEMIMEVVDRHQPQAVVFNMGRPTIRWVGNEDGLAADPCHYIQKGSYRPPECDVPIRRHWFWQPDDLRTLKSREHLLGIYYRSVGLGANLLLNVPPDREGLIAAEDRARLLEMSAELGRRFAQPIPARKRHQGQTVTLTFGREIELDHLVLQERLLDGQKVDGWSLYADESDVPIAEGRTIGQKRILVFPALRARRLRLALNSEARLHSAIAFRTGCEQLPAVAARGPDAEFADKVDRPA